VLVKGKTNIQLRHLTLVGQESRNYLMKASRWCFAVAEPNPKFPHWRCSSVPLLTSIAGPLSREKPSQPIAKS
jgi:hypothetical protein